MLTQEMINKMLHEVKFLYPEEEIITAAKSMEEPETLIIRTDAGCTYKVTWNDGNICTECINF